MNKSTARIALFVCITCILMVGTSLFFSIQLAHKYLGELSAFSQIGQARTGISNSFEYSQISTVSQTNNTPERGDEYASFMYENIDFVSYSDTWDSAKLESLAHELFANAHGEEIAYVAKVELHDDNYDEYAGLHRSSYEKYSLPISVNRLFPSGMTIDFSTLSSVIVLTGANKNTTVASMARTLSHEYGHHYTQYYFGFRGTLTDMSTKYASLRKEQGAPIYAVVTDWDYYIQNHMWDLQEIAAEDYVFFMGSPQAKQQIDFLDNKELASLYAASEKQYNEYTEQPMASGNSYPHENPLLKAPSQVNNLADYYYSFVSMEAPDYTKLTADYGDMSMNMTQTSAGSYTMTWVSPWPYNNITYTLVAYDSANYMLKPIKTINGDENAIANFGLQKTIQNQHEYTIDDTLDTLGYIKFRIVVTFSDGSVVFSDAYDVQF